MEVASCVLPPSADNGGDDAASAPFGQRRRDVREWQRVDCATGAYEHARFEADRRRWNTNTTDDAHSAFNHHYGKLVDSLLRTDPKNGLREAASRQLEVFRSKVPAGIGATNTTTVHVVRSRTSVMASCITASAPASSLSGAAPPAHHAADGSVLEDFQNLQLSVRPLDVTAEKSKAVVCRSASRRPPTRQRSHQRRSQPTSESGSVATPAPSSSSPNHAAAAAAVSLHRVSRLCHQIHASAVRQAFGNIAAGHPTTTPMRRDADVATTAAPTAPTSVEIVELESSSSDRTNASLAHTNLVRTKSSSNEDIHILSQTSNSMNKSIEDLDDFQQLQTWRRTSKIRRSLQFPKQNKQTSDGTSKLVDIPESSVSVKKIKEELEKGRRLDTVLRNNSVDIEALDQILQTIPGGSNSDRNSEEGDSETNKKLKRNSFVTVESIQEVKGRLRRTSSPSSDIYKENCRDEEIDLDADYADDGIVVDEVSCSRNGDIEIPAQSKRETSRVRSYVYGMEAALSHNNAKPTGTCTGTGSLESRVKLVNGSNFSVKNEDWYNRRKSYGFEQVHATEDSSNCILKSKKQVESSTDSGICRSSEIVHKTTNNAYNENDSSVENDPGHKFNGWKEITTGQVKKLASTYDSSSAGDAGELKSTTTITIPIVKNNNVVDLPWYDHQVGGREIKRHSIAVDESRYVRRAAACGGHPNQERKHRRTSLVSTVFPSSNSAAYFEALEDDATAVRRIKKVEFCKTEVHFAAESGKVNIVATDEKPPPTQNFRRRRRSCSSSGPLAEELLGGGGGRLPVLRFGDSSEEQNMFGVGDGAAGAATSPQPQRRHDADAQPVRPPTSLSGAVGVVTVNADSDNAIASCQNDSNAAAAYAATDANTDDLSENEIKGILKNKPIPYHLGQEAEPSPIVADPSSSDGESTKWGVKLRHVSKRHSPAGPEDPPSIWKSTVTVRNIYKNKEGEKEEDERQGGAQEIQKRLRSLRPTKKAVTDAEHRGYSTKINFGEGEAKVVEEEEGRQWERQGWLGNTTWPPVLEDSHLPPHKDSALAVHSRMVDTSNCSNNSLSTEATTSRDQEESRAARRGLSLIRNAESWPPVTPDLDSVEKLSSPSLVGRTGVDHHKLQPSRTTPDNIVLRQPKRSEMTYFGIKVSPSPKKKVSQATIRGETNLVSKKPDPLQHHAKSTSPTRCKYNKPRQKTPEPVYENIYPDKKYKGRELDASGILDELTKADDEILQAVNGYTDEDKKQSTDEEKQKLETIDEAKLWKRPSSSTNGTKPSNMKSKLKHTSSTSSVESITKKRAVEGKIARTTERQQQRSSQQSKKKKQDISDSSTSSKATAAANLKANRRLQRANSREALLHSHGSSSEDLPNRTEVTVRKPRLVKKTKAVQLTMSNGLEMKKKASGSTANVAARKKEDGKADESLPEIRHKTAFSTIRSTSERVTKDRAKYKHEDLKKKIPSKKDTTSRGAADAAQTCSDSKCNRTSPSTTKQCLTSGANGCGGNDVKATALPKGDRQHRSVGFGAGVPVVTQHRISTANIKKCCSSSSKFEGVKP